MLFTCHPKRSNLSCDSSSTSSKMSTSEIQGIVERLKMEHHRSTTRAAYYSVWKTFNKFFLRLDHKPISWENSLTLFVAYLIDSDKAVGTIRSYISTIKAVLFSINIRLTEDKYLLNALKRACRLK